ncbi:hypothetical protein ACUODJ_59465, partial [Escherichia sp. HC-CC]
VWTGDYLLLWKMSPEGESTITRDSSEEEILWLETMLNRALHISTEPSATFSTTEDNHPSIPTQTIYVSASTFADLRG